MNFSPTFSPFWALPYLLMLGALLALYVRGWRRMRQRFPELATKKRLAAFCWGLALVALILLPPLHTLSTQLLAARTLQKVLLCMFVPPLLWYACPIHAVVLALPRRMQHTFTRNVIRRSSVRSALQAITQPGLTWVIYVSAFLVWHDPDFANWTLQHPALRTLNLWLLLLFALFYWSHIMQTSVRLHRWFRGWPVVVYLIAVEVPNMMAGVAIAFNAEPIYQYYTEVRPLLFEQNALAAPVARQISPLEDQMLSGAMTWIIGSIVYIGAVMAVLRQLFQGEPGKPPIWLEGNEATERTIMPGLEHRVWQNRWRKAQAKE